MKKSGVWVRVDDYDMGDSEERPLPANDYLVICGADRYAAHTQVHGNGTHVVTIKAGGGNNA